MLPYGGSVLHVVQEGQPYDRRAHDKNIHWLPVRANWVMRIGHTGYTHVQNQSSRSLSGLMLSPTTNPEPNTTAPAAAVAAILAQRLPSVTP